MNANRLLDLDSAPARLDQPVLDPLRPRGAAVLSSGDGANPESVLDRDTDSSRSPSALARSEDLESSGFADQDSRNSRQCLTGLVARREKAAGAEFDDSCRKTFPGNVSIRRQVNDKLDRSTNEEERYVVNEEDGDRCWILGRRSLAAARYYNGQRSSRDVLDLLQRECGLSISMQSLLKLEETLFDIGLLRNPNDRTRGVVRDHFGALVRAFAHLRRVEVFTLSLAEIRLTSTYRPVAILFSAMIVAFSLWGIMVGHVHFERLLKLLGDTLTGRNLLISYLITFISGVFHEGAHSLACLYYSVPVRRVGLGFCFFMPMGWCVPDTVAFNRQGRWRKLVMILAGPLASAVVAGIALIIWSISGRPTSHVLFSGTIVAGIYGSVVTMIPWFRGDGYLIVTEIFGCDKLRSRATLRVRELLAEPVQVLDFSRFSENLKSIMFVVLNAVTDAIFVASGCLVMYHFCVFFVSYIADY